MRPIVYEINPTSGTLLALIIFFAAVSIWNSFDIEKIKRRLDD